MLIITGASGQLGHAIVSHLVRLVPADQVVATCRHPDQTEDLKELGVEVRHGDFDDAASLSSAFKGITQLLLVSSNARAHGADPLTQHDNAIGAAREAGVQRIVYTSHMAAGTDSAFPPMHDHAATEAMLRDSGVAWTALRHGYYGASGIAMLTRALKTGVLDTAADGPVAWTAHADLAEAAARILADTSHESGPTPPLTNTETLDLGDLAIMASELSGKSITRHILPDDEMRLELARQGMPAIAMDIWMGFHIAARNGEFSTTNPTLANLLGRPPMRMRDLMAQTL